MKTRLIALLAVLALSIFSVAAVASAQSYGDETESSTSSESADTVTDVDDAVGVEIQVTEDGTSDEPTEERRHRRGHRGGCSLEAAATAIGIDEADLKAALDEGQTIAQVAEANGVAVDTVIDAMVDEKAEKLAEKVESGRITQEEADEKLAELEERITNKVNGLDNDGEGESDA